MDLLDQLRRNRTDHQREMLNLIWDSYRKKARWFLQRVLERVFFERLAPNEVTAELERLGGRAVYTIRDENQRPCWALTFLGILLTDEGPELEELCVRYVEYVRKLWLDDAEAELVSSQDAQRALSLSFEEAQLLGWLLRFGYFCGSIRGGPGPQGWTAVLPDDVASMARNPDRHRYLRTQALNGYEPNVPIDEHGLMSYYHRHAGLSGPQWEALQPPLTAELPPLEEVEEEPARLDVGDIENFEKVRTVTPEQVTDFLEKGCLKMSEKAVKRAMIEILNVSYEQPDWGGELNDISTANVLVNGRRRETGIVLKGPGTGRREMSIRDCGKNGDQLVRLFSMAHELFIIQSTGPIADTLVRDVEGKVDDRRNRGKSAQFVIINGQDTARLLFAYGKLR